MKTKSLNQRKQYILLAVYLFLVIASLFHHHSYSFKNGDDSVVSLQNKSEAVNDFLVGSTGICLLDHFLQSINFSDDSIAGKAIDLPGSEEVTEISSSSATLQVFYYSYPLRAPPTI
ncbi:MAG: hypothetical protein COZ80_12860 [Ignavibacteria bacterium CG_4_8_14_3_um_filter_37_9]|nr:hypothetical protein [Ignavibacteria bacterium]OIO18938.1 MAG: hypothetical protein AUJ54_07155 [Ignavibacteria bacterium CG1_02_37_35]PIW98004.1 MAG: hypothetical protein COZ80_12860 [Ignavibacteria bacterium CG_4_8_14_3_um_filter_37_9]PIX93206.1 MAG: hypothetical protein COZ25_11880 [Ignavibacteria bacterium CG_4_10_14_3_um_filter_37_18]PJC60262.1 MAG: hypothetical protein CO025_03670 [Ignavibacteria bacterium CG_4_9_14_0_2_um_filter_37_13]